MPHMQGMMAVNCQKAMAAGLHFRSLHETISDTLRWYAAHEQRGKLRAGLDTDREQQLLKNGMPRSDPRGAQVYDIYSLLLAKRTVLLATSMTTRWPR